MADRVRERVGYGGKGPLKLYSSGGSLVSMLDAGEEEKIAEGGLDYGYSTCYAETDSGLVDTYIEKLRA